MGGAGRGGRWRAGCGSCPRASAPELGAKGHSTDGSQAQQLALARVVLADPHTLILDEATALLDPTTARHTERALVAVLAGRTVIAIAHRLHTAHDADRVAVMEDGLLTELGTHDALVAAGGAYAALVGLLARGAGPPTGPTDRAGSRETAGHAGKQRFRLSNVNSRSTNQFQPTY
ncbi:hypothetical protein STENM327S_07486 [Streptomyces tendae]